MTPTQKKILDFYNEFIKKNGYTPSIPEVAKGLKKGNSTIWEHIHNLKDAGYIVVERNRSRGVRPISLELQEFLQFLRKKGYNVYELLQEYGNNL